MLLFMVLYRQGIAAPPTPPTRDVIIADILDCSEWAQWNRRLGLTPNLRLTGYKTPYLLYYGGSEETEAWFEESEAREKS